MIKPKKAKKPWKNREALKREKERALMQKNTSFFEKNVSPGTCLFYSETLLKRQPFFAMSLLGIALKKGIPANSVKRAKSLALQHVLYVERIVELHSAKRKQILKKMFNPVSFRVFQLFPSSTPLRELQRTTIFLNSVHEKNWKKTIQKIKKQQGKQQK